MPSALDDTATSLANHMATLRLIAWLVFAALGFGALFSVGFLILFFQIGPDPEDPATSIKLLLQALTAAGTFSIALGVITMALLQHKADSFWKIIEYQERQETRASAEDLKEE